jgi:tyrosyl-tRNA synthetase
MSIYEEFEWRGLVYGSTQGARDLLAREKVTCYIGFDATASSLHVGSLLPIVALARAQRFGHTPIAVVGEAASGKEAVRFVPLRGGVA